MEATSVRGEYVNGSHVRFAQRSEHHDSKQPVLVVFTHEDLEALQEGLCNPVLLFHKHFKKVVRPNIVLSRKQFWKVGALIAICW